MTLFNVIVKVVLPNFHFPLPEKHLVILINTLPCCKKKKKGFHISFPFMFREWGNYFSFFLHTYPLLV